MSTEYGLVSSISDPDGLFAPANGASSLLDGLNSGGNPGDPTYGQPGGKAVALQYTSATAICTMAAPSSTATALTVSVGLQLGNDEDSPPDAYYGFSCIVKQNGSQIGSYTFSSDGSGSIAMHAQSITTSASSIATSDTITVEIVLDNHGSNDLGDNGIYVTGLRAGYTVSAPSLITINQGGIDAMASVGRLLMD